MMRKKPEQMFVMKNLMATMKLENYSESVQRRINQLTAKRKQASEEAQAAVQYAQQYAARKRSVMKQRLQQMSVGYNSETENRLKAQEGPSNSCLWQKLVRLEIMKKLANAQQAISQIAM